MTSRKRGKQDENSGLECKLMVGSLLYCGSVNKIYVYITDHGDKCVDSGSGSVSRIVGTLHKGKKK